MSKKFYLLVFTLFAPGLSIQAQSLPDSPIQTENRTQITTEKQYPEVVIEEPVSWELYGPQCRTRPTMWAGAEYLLWMLEDAPLPVPLVSTTNPANLNVPLGTMPTPGSFGAPGTQVLLGNGDIDNDMFSGVRLSLGGWLDREQTWGLEASGFLLESRSELYTFGGPGVTTPIYVPVINQNGNEAVYTVNEPAALINGSFPFQGTLAIESSTEMWGTDFNVYRRGCGQCGLRIDYLFGFSYLDLEENLGLTSNSFDTFILGNELIRDTFETNNQFYGGQIGARLKYQKRFVYLDCLATIAMGVTHQSVNISGSTTQSGGGLPTATFAGGILTAPSNIGVHSTNAFTVVPRVGVKVGCVLTEHIRTAVGYDFLFWSSVVRPGDQIDRTINQTQLTGGALVGPARPQSRTEDTGFVIHGLNLSLEFRY